MKINTSELTENALDWAVAKCKGMDIEIRPAGACGRRLYVLAAASDRTPWTLVWQGWSPSTDWALGGEIIEREEIFIGKSYARGVWTAMKYTEQITRAAFEDGATPLIAAMRCYVASKMGNEIEIPENLI
jgi:hypothetical protein